MPLDSLLAIGSGLLGGYVQGQRLKQEFEKEREELAFKKKHLEVQEGLLHRQLQHDLLQSQDKLSEVISTPGGDLVKKHGGDIVRRAPPPQTLRDFLVGTGVTSGQPFPVRPPGSTEPFPASEGTPSPGGPATSTGSPLDLVPPGLTVHTPATPGGRITAAYDPNKAAEFNRRVMVENRMKELSQKIATPGPVDWQAVQNEAQKYLDIPSAKGIFDRATTELDKMQPTKPSEERESTADKLYGLPWRKLSKDQKVGVDADITQRKTDPGVERMLALIGGGLQLSGLTEPQIAGQVDMAAKSIVSGDRSIQDWEALLGPRNWNVLGPRVSAKVNELTGGKGPPAAMDPNSVKILTALGPARGETAGLRQLLEPFKANNNPGYFAPWRLLYAAGASPGTPAGTAAESQARQEASMKFFRGRYETLNGEQQTKVDKYLELGRRIADFELNRVNAMIPYFRAAGGRPNEMFQEMVKKHITQLWKDSPQLLYEKLSTITQQFDRMEAAVRTYGRKTGVPGVVPPSLGGSPPSGIVPGVGGGGAGISVPTPSGMATVRPRQ